MFFTPRKTENTTFGPPYAVLNVSKIGLRYFRICIQASEKSRGRLLRFFVGHPNVGWVFSAEGWFNIGIGIWAQSNSEINEISSGIRKELDKDDLIVYQSELTSLHGFGNRPITKDDPVMTIVDSVLQSIELTPIEIDYLKIVTQDSSIPLKDLSAILGRSERAISALDKKLTGRGVIVGHQQRINYGGIYLKVFIDSLTIRAGKRIEDFLAFLWKDNRCIYVERANGKYDVEFEVIVREESEFNEFLSDFSDYQTAILTENLYTNLFPLNKVANLKQILDTLSSQAGPIIDFRNSKLWYLNYRSADAYLTIYEDRKYFETMEKSELDLFEEVASSVRDSADSDSYSIVDIGSGDGLKGRIFIEKIGEKNVKAYYPVDIQPIELAAALKTNQDGSYSKHPVLLDFENLSSRFPLKLLPGEQQLYLFLGGTYGNFQSETINAYLKPLLNNPQTTLLVTMPIVAGSKSKTQIIESYANKKFEDISFGPLLQLGFSKDDFEINETIPELHVRIEIDGNNLVSSFILKNESDVAGRNFDAGTIFKMTYSWKPTLEQFREAIETDFVIEKIFHNDEMAIVLIRLPLP